MIPVLIESPFSGTSEEMLRNRNYLWKCLTWCYTNNKAPIALHALYPYLPDGKLHSDDEEVKTDNKVSLPGREYALGCNRVWRNLAEEVWFFIDHGVSSGMKQAIKECVIDKKKVVIAYFNDDSYYNNLIDGINDEYLKENININFIKKNI